MNSHQPRTDTREVALLAAFEYPFGSDNIETIQRLVSAGTNVNIADEHGETPLGKAVSINKPDIVQLLLSAGADVNAAQENGNTPLHCAMIGDRAEIARLLLSANADIHKVNRGGDTPLHWARGEAEAKLLLQAGANADAINDGGGTPLHLTSENGHVGAVRQLLLAGADVNALSPVRGWTPLHCAASHRGSNTDVLELLLSANADVNAVDNDGNRPIDLVVRDELRAGNYAALRAYEPGT